MNFADATYAAALYDTITANADLFTHNANYCTHILIDTTLERIRHHEGVYMDVQSHFGVANGQLQQNVQFPVILEALVRDTMGLAAGQAKMKVVWAAEPIFTSWLNDTTATGLRALQQAFDVQDYPINITPSLRGCVIKAPPF